MIKKIILILSILIISSCNISQDNNVENSDSNETNKEKNNEEVNNEEVNNEQIEKQELKINDLKVEEYIDNLDSPWSILFLDKERVLVSQRWWNIILIKNWTVQNNNYWLADSKEIWEWWLMWIEKDPNYNQNKYIYVMYTYSNNNWELKNKVVRLTDDWENAIYNTTIIDNIPWSRYHNWWRIKFWTDEKLYIATWDASNPQLSQDINSLAWKILRINNDWTIPESNPFKNSPVYTLWHRNPQSIAIDPKNWEIFIASHWPTWEFWLRNRDRFDYLEKWENYWWPNVTWYSKDYKDPLIYWPETATPPAWMTFWNWYIFMTTLKRETLFQIKITKKEWKYKAEVKNKLFVWKYWRLRDAYVWPNNSLYILTSNTDGRWNINKWDDKILKISN